MPDKAIKSARELIDLITSTDSLVSITAPLLINDLVYVGYAIGPDESYCAEIQIDEFMSVCDQIYFQMDGSRAFHGLKRTLEYLDEIHGKTNSYLHKYINIQSVLDTKLLAFLLDPDSDVPSRVPFSLTLRNKNLVI